MDRKLVVSLFCGIGGMDLGFESAGYEIAIAIDNNQKVIDLYKLNFPNTLAICRDISTITALEIVNLMAAKYPDWDGQKIAAVIGGSPCQGFSVAGKQDLTDPRSQLLLKFVTLAIELNPKVVVLENVPAINFEKFKPITDAATKLLLNKWNVTKLVLTASDYGVPQKRKRSFWIGQNCQTPVNPTPTRQFTVENAIADLSSTNLSNHCDVAEIFQATDYTKYLATVFPKLQKCDYLVSGFLGTEHSASTIQKYAYTDPGTKEASTWAYRLKADAFAPTLRAGSGNRTATRPIHYQHPRVITVREAARLHSYPDWFQFGNSKLQAHKAIGNSVPPLLARAVALAI